jgi:hypothetical protein
VYDTPYVSPCRVDAMSDGHFSNRLDMTWRT